MPTDSTIEVVLPAAGPSPSRRGICLVLAAAMVGLLFYLGGKPMAVGLFPEPLDKLAHLVFFATIAALLWIGAGGRLPLLIIALVAGIGILDEWHQAYLPGRSADLMDFLTDVAAATLMVSVLHIRHIWKNTAIRW